MQPTEIFMVSSTITTCVPLQTVGTFPVEPIEQKMMYLNSQHHHLEVCPSGLLVRYHLK